MGITSMFKSTNELRKKYESIRKEVRNNSSKGILDIYEIADRKSVDRYVVDYNRIQDIYGDGSSKLKVIEATNKMKKLHAALKKYDDQLEKFRDEYVILSREVYNGTNGVLDQLRENDDEPSFIKYLGIFDEITSLCNEGNLYSVQNAIKKMQKLKGVVSNHIAGMKSAGDLAGDAQNKTEFKKSLNSRIKEKKGSDKKTLELIEKEVKDYVKSKVGSFEYFNSRIGTFANSYKGENEYIPIEYMREIYGTKGALMMICNLENGNIMKRKMFSTYRRVCDLILKNYRSLKVEAALAVVKNKSLNDKFDIKDVNEINTTLYKLGVLENEILLKQDWKLRFLQNTPYLKSKYGIDPKARVFSFWEYITQAEDLIPRLKNIEGKSNRERKEMINRVIRKIRKVKGEGVNYVEEALKRKEYLEKYNAFIENSSNLALGYLKKEGARKIKKLNIDYAGGPLIQIGSDPRDYSIDTCKIALMCLVAVCSKNKAKIAEGERWFGMNEPFLRKHIG